MHPQQKLKHTYVLYDAFTNRWIHALHRCITACCVIILVVCFQLESGVRVCIEVTIQATPSNNDFLTTKITKSYRLLKVCHTPNNDNLMDTYFVYTYSWLLVEVC